MPWVYRRGMPWLDEALDRLAKGRVAVLGDLALDAYWILDAEHRETSIETGLPVQRVATQRYSPGGAANVIANLVDLGVPAVHAIGLVGDDLFGRELRRMLADRGASVDGVVPGGEAWQTLVFAKPHLDGAEQSRLDFGSRNERSMDAGARLLAEAKRLAASVDAFVLNQQVTGGVLDEPLVAAVNAIIKMHPDCVFVVDSRDLAQRFWMAVITINAQEARRWLDATQPADKPLAIDEVREMAVEIQRQTMQPVFISHGADGIVVAEYGKVEIVPGVEVAQPTDPVGAGDAVTATLAAVLGAGGDCVTAARLANLAAAVTVAKVGITGTASPDEIRALAQRQRGAD